MRLGPGTAMALMHSNRKNYMGNASRGFYKFFLFFSGEMPEEGQIKASLSGKSLSPGTGSSSTDYVSGQRLLEDNSANLIAVHSTYNRTYPHVDGSPSEEISLDFEAELPITVDLTGRGSQVPFTCFNPGKVTWFAHIVCDPSKSDIDPFTSTIFKAGTRCVHALVGSVGLSGSGADLELSTTDFVLDPKGLFFPKFVKFNMKIGQQEQEKADPPGSTSPISEDSVSGFYGEVLASDLMLYSEASRSLGFNKSQYKPDSNEDAWLKFKVEGRTIYIAKTLVTSEPQPSTKFQPQIKHTGSDTYINKAGNLYKLRVPHNHAEVTKTLQRLLPSLAESSEYTALAEYTEDSLGGADLDSRFPTLRDAPDSWYTSSFQYSYIKAGHRPGSYTPTYPAHYRPVLELVE